MAPTKRKVSELEIENIAEPSSTSSPTFKKHKSNKVDEEVDRNDDDDDEIFEIKSNEKKRSSPRLNKVLTDKNNNNCENSVDTNNNDNQVTSKEKNVKFEKENLAKTSKPSAKKTSLAKKSVNKLNNEPKCAMCGRDDKTALKETKKLLTITSCCQYWICDDEHTYKNPRFNDIFSSIFKLHDSCSREHKRYSVCHFHWQEGHSTKTDFRDCKQCLKDLGASDQGEIVHEENKADLKCNNCQADLTGPDQIYGTAYDRSSKKYNRYCKKTECQILTTKKKK